MRSCLWVLWQVVEKIATRVRRLLVRRGLMEEHQEVPDEEHPFQRASAQGRILLGERSGQRVQRVGQTWMFGPPPPRKLPRRCAVSEGFNLHAGVRIGRRQWSRLEKLCCYIARSPLAKERLSLREDGQIILKLKRPWPKAAPFMAPMHCSLSPRSLSSGATTSDGISDSSVFRPEYGHH